ncbi:hypothetical protein PILCRDRAFT_702405 [Piloderma croceum F 1598]|uniref:Glycoside hydrolase family 105 protein n=1 Tax=Piloderma croceum (strain F 1598) TaxID=765440 RepID=A0A0C3F3E1_PILCF|nr:hypothetical protein PILCRDRAFT_702405 [Piloderma croceum F 1598]
MIARTWLAVVYTAAFTRSSVWAESLSDADISLVEDRLAEGAQASEERAPGHFPSVYLLTVLTALLSSYFFSWELGTRSQALLELNAKSYSVLSDNPLPPPSTIATNLGDAMSTVLGIAKSVVSNRSVSNGGKIGPQPLMNDSAAGDPASLGMVVLLANWTGQQRTDGLDYAGAAQDQLDFLFQDVPQTSDGAISHRTDQLQLWSDFVYMAPPFLAYFGMISQNQTLLSEAYNQISLYRNYLRDSSANNLWKHIVLGTGVDEGHWATGNGWAAAGILRVLGTIQNSKYAKSMMSEQKDLANWVKEIQDGMYGVLDSNWLFKNYPDQNLSATNFYDASSTAIMASTVYRMALMSNVHTHVPLAEKSRLTLSALSSNASSSDSTSQSTTATNSTISRTTSTTSAPSSTSTSPSTLDSAGPLQHFTSSGWLTPVVDPYMISEQGTTSPEGEAFVLEMTAAWKDWVAAGSPGANGCLRVSVGWAWAVTLGTGVVLRWSL